MAFFTQKVNSQLLWDIIMSWKKKHNSEGEIVEIIFHIWLDIELVTLILGAHPVTVVIV